MTPLKEVLHRLVDAGNTMIIIKHNLDVIKTAGWIIDLEPEEGEKGGYIVGEGTPEQASSTHENYTGKIFRGVLRWEALLGIVKTKHLD